MKMRTVRIPMDDHYLEYQVDGATAYGSDEVLLEKEDNLIAGTSWAGAGYTVAPFLADDSYETLLEGFKVNIHDVVKKFVESRSRSFRSRNTTSSIETTRLIARSC